MDICEYKVRVQMETRHPWEIARARFIAKLVENYLMPEDGPIRLLDFGCGDGFVARYLAERFSWCRFVAVDKRIREIKHEQESKRIIFLENLDEYQGAAGSFDGCLLLDVLEHISADEAFLKMFFNNKFFSEQARFVITCPAYGKLFSHHDTLLGHFKRYSLPELRRKIDRAGGECLESGYIFCIPLVIREKEVLFEKMGLRNEYKKTQISTWRGGRLVTYFYASILYFDAVLSRLLRRLSMPGLTCYIICRKQVS